MSDFQAREPRPMHDITSLNLSCAQCGAAITELPFEPTQREDGTFGRLYCRDCNRQRIQRKRNFGGGGDRRPRY